jgi:hypothetical protein
MSEVMPEGLPPQAVDPSAIEQPMEPIMPSMARYAIHIPVRDADRNEIPHVLGAARQALSDAGLEGRIVLPNVQGDWSDYQTDEIAVVMTDAPDDPSVLATVKEIATGVKQLAMVDAVYVTVQPIQTFIV